jgi:hypothetical protein
MRFIVTLKAGEVERELAGNDEQRPTREQRIAVRKEADRRIQACISRVRRVLPDGVEIQPLFNVNSLIVSCPQTASLAYLRDAIYGACPDVEAVTEDFALEHVASLPHNDDRR